MKMKSTDPILDQLKDLITDGINFAHEADSPFPLFHHDLVRHYFDAGNVEIDYQKETVKVEIPVGEKKYTRVTFNCRPLEEFLRSCLKTDRKSLEYYKDLLVNFAPLEVS